MVIPAETSFRGDADKAVGPPEAPVPQPPPAAPVTHVVAGGETVALIAARYGLETDALVALNQGLAGDPNRLFTGEVLALAPGAPSRLQPRQPVPTAPAGAAAGSGAPSGRGVLWTFDDCEAFRGQGNVARELQTLAAYGGQAIFFMTGDCYRSRPDLVAMIGQGGHPLGNHTSHHPALTALSAAAVEAEIRGGAPGRYFRPPYGLHSPTIDEIAARLGYTVLLWSADSGDTTPGVMTSCNAILANLRARVTAGSVVLMHMQNSNTPAALAAYLAGKPFC